jgi:hypothetical protein
MITPSQIEIRVYYEDTDAVMAKRINSVRSNNWRFDNGESPPAELERALIRHDLMNYELR